MKSFLFATLIFLAAPQIGSAAPRHPVVLVLEFFEWLLTPEETPYQASKPCPRRRCEAKSKQGYQAARKSKKSKESLLVGETRCPPLREPQESQGPYESLGMPPIR